MDPARRKGSRTLSDPRIPAIPDIHGHAKGEHRPFAEERPISYSARMLFLWFYHACRRGSPRFLMVSDHINYLTFEDPGAVHTVRRALKLAHAGDLYGAAETAGVDVAHAAVVSEGLRRGMRFAIGAEADNDPRARPDAANIVEAMRPDGIIRTVHFITIDHPEKGADWPWPFDNPEFAHLHDVVGAERTWELYVAKLLDDIEKLPGNVVGHFYVPAEFGHWPSQKKLEEYENQVLDAAGARGMAIEINTRFLYRDNPDATKKKYLEANARLIKKAKAKGVGIAIGSDAHSPKDQGNAFDKVLELLDACGVNEIVFPVGGRLARVVLRATREHLEAHAKTREVTTPGSSISGFSRAELGLPEQVEVPGGSRGRVRDVGPKKRTADATRTTKRPEPSGGASKSSSKRSVESSTSSSKAKAARKSVETKKAAKPAKAVPKAVKPVKSAAKPAKPVAKAKAAKPAPKAKPPAKPKPAPKKAAVKAKTPVKPAAKKIAPKKPVAKAPAPKKAAVKAAAPKKKLAPKPAAKKVAKKVTKPSNKVATAKKKPAAKRR